MRQHLSRFISSNTKRAGLWFGVAVLCVAGLVNVSPAGTQDPLEANASKGGSQNSTIQREGSKLTQVVGYFRQASGRITFVPKENSKTGFVCVENLMLQRVSEDLTDQTEFGEWLINGELTEFRNSNYLIIKTAQHVE